MTEDESMSSKPIKVAGQLRGRIVGGEFQPGDFLPDRLRLCEQLGVSLNTIQQAMEELRRDGFIESRSRVGTRVVLHPPHLTRVALVWHQHATWSLFIRAIRESIARRLPAADVDFREYPISTDFRDCREAMRLIDDAKAHRIGGLVFLTPPSAFADTGALDDLSIPRVGVTESWGYPVVTTDANSFRQRAMDYLVSHGRRRIAHLQADAEHVDTAELEVWLRRYDLPSKPYWLQALPVTGGRGFRVATGVVNLLIHLPADERPDALVIHDDNLVEPAVAGLVASGVSVPHDLEIVAHANFPLTTATLLPVTRLGFDCGALVEACVASIRRQRVGSEHVKATALPAMFENEYAAVAVTAEVPRQDIKSGVSVRARKKGDRA
jgi:DNA-binding LacI/PurR family transcriptional regulator